MVASHKVVVLLLAGALILAAHLSVARACSPRGPGVSSRHVYPASGTTGHATNTQVKLYYSGWDAVAGDVKLRRAGGPALAVTVTVEAWRPWGQLVRIRPKAALAPNAKYEVLDRLAKLPCYKGGWPPDRRTPASPCGRAASGPASWWAPSKDGSTASPSTRVPSAGTGASTRATTWWPRRRPSSSRVRGGHAGATC